MTPIQEVEYSLLHALLEDPSSLSLVDLEPDHFGIQLRPVFKTMLAMVSEGEPLDYAVLIHRMGVAYAEVVMDIQDAIGPPKNIPSYTRAIKENTQQTIVREVAQQLLTDGDEQAAIQQLLNLSRSECRHLSSIGDNLKQVFEKLQNPDSLKGYSTGFPTLDRRFGGFHPSDLHIVGARPAVGKTAIMLNFARAANEPCLVISGEQGSFQVAMRLLVTESKVALEKMRSGNIDESDWPDLRDAAARLHSLPIYIYDRPAPTLQDIQREARRAKHEHGVKLVFVDYLQRMKAADPRIPRHQQVEHDVKGLKEIARELDLAVIALAQVARRVDEREDKTPHMADLGDSGAIEREADMILTLYRKGAYERNLPSWTEDTGVVSVEKNRHGTTGHIPIMYHGELLRFVEIEQG